MARARAPLQLDDGKRQMTGQATAGSKTAGPVLIVAGLVLAFVLFLQPWVSCEDDDSSAGCPVPAELVGWTYAGWALTLAMIVGGALLAVRASRRQE